MIEAVCNRCLFSAELKQDILSLAGDSQVFYGTGDHFRIAKTMLPDGWELIITVPKVDQINIQPITTVLCPACVQAFEAWCNEDPWPGETTAPQINAEAFERRLRGRKTATTPPTQQTDAEGRKTEPCDWCGTKIVTDGTGGIFRDTAMRPYCNEKCHVAKHTAVGGGPGPQQPGVCEWCSDELDPTHHPHTCQLCPDEFCSKRCFDQHRRYRCGREDPEFIEGVH